MLGLIAFFVLLIVFTLAAQLVGYIEHLQRQSAKRKGKDRTEEGCPWPTLQNSPESFAALPADATPSLPDPKRNAAPPSTPSQDMASPIFPLDSETVFAVNER